MMENNNWKSARNYNSFAVIVIFSLYFFQLGDAASNMFVTMGGTATMNCYDPAVASNDPNFFVTLYFYSSISNSEKRELLKFKPVSETFRYFTDTSPYKNRLTILLSGQAKLSDVGLSDEGMYECVSNTFEASLQPVTTNITVNVPPRVEVRKLVDPLVAESSWTDVAMCAAYGGKPAPLVTWSAKNLQVNQTFETEYENSGLTTVISTLRIEPFKFYNKQIFTCEVVHAAFSKKNTTHIELNVTYPPDKPIIYPDSQNKFLTCKADGNPEVTYTWKLPNSAPSTTATGPTVPIYYRSDPLHSNDTYTCIASNGVGQPQTVAITQDVALYSVASASPVNVGTIVGVVIGGLLALAIILVLLYFFVVKKYRKDDDVSYPPHRASFTGSGGYGRPTIQHANDSLNKNRPPSPARPPPDEKLDHEDSHSSGSESEDEGKHDIDLEGNADTALMEPAFDKRSETGITSRSSMNFRARRQRPSASPTSRRSRIEGQMHRSGDDSPPAPRQNNRYDLPPADGYHDGDDFDSPRGGMGDYTGQDLKGDNYPAYRQPPYVAYFDQNQQPPRRTDSLPQYEPKYSEIDHFKYGPGSASRRPPHEEPVEYAQIRHGYSHVV